MTLSAHVSIAHPAWMDITGPDGAVTHGADQDWFPDLWQQRAGCGPTAAAVILSYLARTRPELYIIIYGQSTIRNSFKRN